MSSAEPVIIESNANGEAETPAQRLSLLDRMDPSIGEASVGIGAMLTELVRRSLRGGVSNIDQHLQEFAEVQVDAALERQLPLVRDVATEIADATSREISRIAADRLTEETNAKAQQLRSALQDADSRLTQTLTDVDQRLSRSLDETGRKFADAILQTETQARDAAAAVSSSVNRLEQETKQTATQLAETIASGRRETDESLRTFETELRESAKRSWQKVNVQLEELRGQTAAIPQVSDRVAEVETAQRDGQQRQQQQLGQLQQQLAAQRTQLQTELQEQVRSLEERLGAALLQYSNLTARLDELERPRGIRAWFQRLRGGGESTKQLPEG